MPSRRALLLPLILFSVPIATLAGRSLVLTPAAAVLSAKIISLNAIGATVTLLGWNSHVI